MNNSQGSLWRKWDLHFHTPASFDYGDKSLTAAQIMTKLKERGISVVAITDHHKIDVPMLEELKKAGGNEVVVLPGIELRTELGGKESVHLIGIFPDDCNVLTTWTKLQGPLEITAEDVAGKTDERVYVDFKKAAELIHRLGGIVTVHAGSKSNSIEGIKNALLFKQQLKEDLALEHIDIYEVASPKDIAAYQQFVFPDIGRTIPIIIASDNHDAKAYVPAYPCWIKADPTFKGLLQVLNEPLERVYIGEVPPQVQCVTTNRTKYIRSIQLSRKPGSDLAEKWFEDTNLPLNPGLVAIIGNKGAGKSALADIIGLLGNTWQSGHFSFLNQKKFNQPRNGKAAHFVATIEWESGLHSSKCLNETPDPDAVQLVRYIPQNYLEELCNEIGGAEVSAFDRELEAVIFSHVPEEDRLKFTSLRDLIGFRTEETYHGINAYRNELRALNKQIADLEIQGSTEQRKSLQSQLDNKQKELEAHLTAKPTSVEEPLNDSPELAAVSQAVADKESALVDLRTRIERILSERAVHNRVLASVQRLQERLDILRRQFDAFQRECADDVAVMGLSMTDIADLTINLEPVLLKKAEAESRVLETVRETDASNQGSLAAEEKIAEAELKELRAKLDGPNVRYQEYKIALAAWEKRQREFVGSPDLPDSLAFYQNKISDLANIPSRIEALRLQQMDKALEIYRGIQRVAAVSRYLYQPVQKFIEEHKLVKDKFNLNFEVSIVDTGFQLSLLEKINQGVTGSFMGKEEGEKRLAALMQRHQFDAEDSVKAFLQDIMEHLTSDKRSPVERSVRVADQLRRNVTLEELYNHIFSLSYLEPKYILKLGDKLPEQLSPGEKGTLLLIFYLLVDHDNVPLIIDQPEENLDNQTVFDLLVPCIKEARERRQVIIVTHNPNLAVVCDAEQVIFARLDKQDGNRLSYASGAIENSEMNQHIVEVLEGTLPAFANREFKYRPHNTSLVTPPALAIQI